MSFSGTVGKTFPSTTPNTLAKFNCIYLFLVIQMVTFIFTFVVF